MLSTQNLSHFLSINNLKRLCQSLAMLDAILQPEWQYRYHSFDATWGLASMRTGSGDEYFALFTDMGAILKGFAHESPMSPYQFDAPRVWPGVLDEVPEVFASFLTEPAFSIADTTFCIWCLSGENEWKRGNIRFPADTDPDGSKKLLALLDGQPRTYQRWAETYFECSIDLEAIEAIYAHQPLTESLVYSLNSEISLADLAQDKIQISY